MLKKTYFKPAIELTFMHQEVMKSNTNASTSSNTDNTSCSSGGTSDGPSGCGSADTGCTTPDESEPEFGKKGSSVWSVWDD